MKTMVSVLCTAYNQEKYIEEALKSFVNQRTDFPFEVIVHDDASTDRTPKIIQEYAEKYPGIIKPIFQKENQYSKGVSISCQYMIPFAKGKYLAFTEGDDYWISLDKLQTQVAYMETHPECTLCIHNAEMIKENGKLYKHWIVAPKERNFSTEEVIIGGGDFCATNSIMAPMRIAKGLPDYFYPPFDYWWQIYLSSQGTTHCFPQRMSAYRVGAIGSWTARRASLPKEKISEDRKRWAKALNKFDADTNEKYHKAVQIVLDGYLLEEIFLFQNKKLYLDNKKRCDSARKLLPLKRKLKLELLLLSPFCYKVLKNLYLNTKKTVKKIFI